MNKDVLDDILGDIIDKPVSSVSSDNQTVLKKEIKMEEKETKETKDKDELLPGCSLDIGTSNLVFTRQTKTGKFINKYHRNMFYALDVSDDTTDLLTNSNYLYTKIGHKYYILGDDALKISAAMGGDVLRSMENGILNPNIKESSELILHLIKVIVGEPICKEESIRFVIPASPINSDIDNTFHKMVLQGFLKSLGYSPKSVNESSCVAYSENPVLKTEDGDIPMSGIAISCGAGQTNIALMFKGMELSTFSITKSGDYIDEMSSKATGISKSKIIRKKEKELDLEKDNSSERVFSALSIYYSEYVNRITNLIGKEFEKRGSELQGDVEIVIAGGTSLPKGFIKLFEEAIKEANLPFKIYSVRHASNPFFTVSNGACIRSRGDYLKSLKK